MGKESDAEMSEKPGHSTHIEVGDIVVPAADMPELGITRAAVGCVKGVTADGACTVAFWTREVENAVLATLAVTDVLLLRRGAEHESPLFEESTKSANREPDIRLYDIVAGPRGMRDSDPAHAPYGTVVGCPSEHEIEVEFADENWRALPAVTLTVESTYAAYRRCSSRYGRLDEGEEERVLRDQEARMRRLRQVSQWEWMRVAAMVGDSTRVSELISIGSPLQAYGEWVDENALHVAASGGHLEVLRILLSHCSESQLDASDVCGLTPLSWAANIGRLDIAELLLAHGADINTIEGDGIPNTPLRQVVDGAPLHVLKFLVDHGADWDVPGWMQLTARDIAEERIAGQRPYPPKPALDEAAEAEVRAWLVEELARKPYRSYWER